MKIIQINVEFGNKLPSLLELIAAEKPDIICAQEVQSTKVAVPLAENFQTLEFIKTAGNFEHVFFSPTWGGEMFGTTLDIGNAIFSKLPLKEQETIFTCGRYKPRQMVDDWTLNIRNVQLAKTDLGPNSLVIANHQGYLVRNSAVGGEETIKYSKALAAALKPHMDCLIMCGDLNIIKESPGFAPIAELGLRNLTAENNTKTTLSSAHRALNKDSVACDYVLCSKSIAVKNFRAVDKVVSDHKALILEFDI